MNLNRPELLQTGAFIDGKWLQTENTFAVEDPATGKHLANVAKCGVAEAEQAIASAERAFRKFRSSLALERSALLRRWADLIMANQDDLATIIVSEQGKTWGDAIGEIAYATSFLYWFAEESRRSYGEVIPTHLQGARVLTLRQPIGPVALMTPWNFPIAMLTRKVGPAIAAGCSTVSRPSSQTPLSANAITVLAEEAGFAPGLINVLAGSHNIGNTFCHSPVIQKVSFTGSTEVGKQLMQQCADTVKKVSMELGGNAPFIVFADADLDKALDSLMVAKFRNTGQSCIGANRIFIERPIYDQFVQRFAERVKSLKQGNGLEKSTQIGPMIHAKAAKALKELVDEGLGKGAKLLCGGQLDETLGPTFLQATVLADCTDEMRLAREELFGPVAPCFVFDSEEEVITRANQTEFGLAAYFCTQALGRSWRVSEGLEAGIIGVNEGFVSNTAAPFGGWKESGIGREGSRHGLDDYTEIKYVLAGGLNGK